MKGSLSSSKSTRRWLVSLVTAPATEIKEINSLIVKQRKIMTAVMEVLRMYQSSDQAVLNFIARLKLVARLCKFEVKCE